MSGTVLVGPASLDRYVDEGLVLPGGGALNMAYHWATIGVPFVLVTRIGDDHPEVFQPFLRRHGIACSPDLVAPGPSASIDIVIRDDRQPWMDHFVEGVWGDFRLTERESEMVHSADRVHVVLVEAVAREVHRLGADGVLPGAGRRPTVSGDFLSFRHYDLERFEATMRWLDLGIVGWPGGRDDDTVVGLRRVAFDLGRLVAVTLGAHGVLVFDGRDGRAAERFVPVEAVEVAGTTVGCGDAFIAAFLASWWVADDVEVAVAAGMRAGAAATAWLRPLPDAAF